MTILEQLQNWYLSHCNDEWEHGFGVKIETIDNPGWSCVIALSRTPFESSYFVPIRIERSENDWLMLSATSTEFKIHCGPGDLEESLAIFLDWVHA